MKISKLFILSVFFCTMIYQSNFAQNLHLTIQSNTDKETSVIDSIGYKKTFKDLKSLKDAVSNIQTLLQQIGYIENRLLKLIKKNDSLYTANVELGKQFYTIYIYYDENIVSRELLETISNDVSAHFFVLKISNIESALNTLTQRISENGLPFTNLQLINLKKRDDKNLRADLQINTNSKRTIDAITIKGYEKFPKSFLKHFLKIKEGNILNINDLNKKLELLNTLPFTNQIREPEILFSKDSSKVFLYLKKQSSNTFDGILGFNTNESTNKIEFNGYLNLSLVNNLNYGESLNIVYKSDENEQRNFNITANLPYIFNTPIGSELSLKIFKKDSTFTTVHQSADIYYQLNSKQRLFLGVSAFESNNLLNLNPQSNIEDLNATFYSIRYHYLKRLINNPLYRTNFEFDIKVGLGNRKYSTSKEQQRTFSLNTNKLFHLNSKNSFFFNIQSEGIDSKNYFENELLRFGGINSIRGFEENSLLATIYGVLNIEYRYLLNKTLYVHSITDAAYLQNSLSDTKSKLFGFGFGIGLLTRSGLFRLNYANGKFEDQKIRLSNSKIHLSFIAEF